MIKTINKKKLSLKMKKIKASTNDIDNSDDTNINSREEVAKYYDVSSSYIAKAKEVKDNNPDLLNKVLNGEASLEEAYKQVKQNDFEPKTTLATLLSDYESEFSPLSFSERITIDFLIKLGLSDVSASNTIINLLKKENKLKQNWVNQSGNTKFTHYLNDFLEFMK